MKRILLYLFLFSSITSAQLPQLLISEFAQTNNTNLVGTDSWIASPYSSDGSLVTSNGTAVASNSQGVNFYGGLVWNSLGTNNGTDTAIFAFSIPQKSITNRYYNGLPGVSDVEMYLFMDGTGPTWNGTVCRLISWDNDQYSIVFNSVTNGCVDYSSCTNYGGSGGADWNASAGNATDTLAIKIIGQTIIVERHSSAGVAVVKNVTSARTIPSTGYFGVRLRLSTSPTTQLGACFLGAGTFVPPAEVLRDTIPPVKVTAAPNTAAIDTSTFFYFIFRAQDNNTTTQKNPGLKYMTIRVDSLGGPFKDSVSSLSNYPNIASGDSTIISVSKKRPYGWYLVTNTAVDDTGNVLIYQYQVFVGTAQTLKVMAYYDIWQWSNGAWWSETPDKLNYHNGITHIIEFMNGNIRPLVKPWFGPVSGVDLQDSLDCAGGSGRPTTLTPYRDWWIDSCHNNNIRALLCINAVNPNNLIAVIDVNANGVVDGADSARADTLANTVALFLARHRYDGVDVNIEHDAGGTAPKLNVGCFLRRLRVHLAEQTAGAGGAMLLTLSPTSGDWNNYDIPSLNTVADFVNVQTYDQQYSWNPCVSSNANWYWSAVYHASDAQLAAHTPPYNVCWDAPNRTSAISLRGPLQWIARGMTAGKMGVGVSSYGRLHSGSLDPYGPLGTDNYIQTLGVNTGNVFLNNLLAASPSATTRFDTVTKGTYTSGLISSPLSFTGAISGTFPAGTNVYYTYPTQATIQADIDWCKANGVGSIMIFDYQYDNNSSNPDITKRNPVIETIANLAGGGVVTVPPPIAPSNISPSNLATGQALTGLTFTWSSISGATSYTLQLSTVSNFSSIDRQGVLTGTSATIGTFPFVASLSPSQIYYWKVSATTAGGTSSYSTATSFTTMNNLSALPHVPEQLAPTNGSPSSSTNVTLSIRLNQSFSDTVSNILWNVKTDTVSSADIVLDTSANSLTYNLTSLLPSVKYFWRAATKNSVGKSVYTGWFNFTISISTPVPPKYKTPTVYDPSIRKNLPTGTPTSGLVFKDDPLSSFQRPAFGNVAWGPRGFVDSTLHQVVYVTFDNLPGQSTVINPISPLAWNSQTNTLSMFPASATQAGYLAAAEYASRIQGSRFYWRLGSGARDSAGIVFKAGSNVTLTQSTGVVDTVTISASGSGSSDPDTTIFTKMSLRDEFVRGNDGASDLASGTSGNSTTWQGELGWVPYALTVGNRAHVFTTGSQFVNTATYGGDIGWTYLTAPDSSDGTTPTGGWLTLAKNGPVIYARPVKAILYFFFQAPEADSSVSSIGISGKSQGSEDGRLLNTEQMSLEISNSNAAQETVYAVCANGSAKTRTFMQTAAAGSIWKGKIEMNSSSVSFYAGVKGGALSAATTISTNLPAGTNGLTPYIGGWTYKKRCNGAGVNTNHVTAIGDWQFDWWVAK